MSEVTIGAFLVEKVHNMASWLRAEGLDAQDLLLLRYFFDMTMHNNSITFSSFIVLVFI